MPVKKIVIERANRLHQMPPDLMSFARQETRPGLLKRSAVIDLASFRWPAISSSDSIDMRPADEAALTELRAAIADWFENNWSVRPNERHEIIVGGGISNLLGSVALAFVDPGDIAFVPELGLPIYRQVINQYGGEAISYGMSRKNQWRPDFERVQGKLGRVARLLFLNSPHNPTGTKLSVQQLEELVFTASKDHIVLVNDAAYFGIDDSLPVSMLQIPGGRKVGVELFSFSYLLGLPYFPMGFAVGNREVLRGVKQALAIQRPYIPAGYVEMALRGLRQFPSEELKSLRSRFRKSASAAQLVLDTLELESVGSGSIPFIWAQLPERHSSMRAARLLLRRSRVMVVPGGLFGEVGNGYLRISLTAEPDEFSEAGKRVKTRLRRLRTALEEDEE